MTNFNNLEHLNSNNSPFRFNAKELDSLSRLALRFGKETGNYYYGARYYDPKFSIWISVDPLAEHMPEWSSYAYTFNNPVRYTDPTGMVPEGGGCGCPPDCDDDSDIPKPVQDIMDFFRWFTPSSNKKSDDPQPKEDNETNSWWKDWAIGIFDLSSNSGAGNQLPGNKPVPGEGVPINTDDIAKLGNSKTLFGKLFDFANYFDWWVDNTYNDGGHDSNKALKDDGVKNYFVLKYSSWRKTGNRHTVWSSYDSISRPTLFTRKEALRYIDSVRTEDTWLNYKEIKLDSLQLRTFK